MKNKPSLPEPVKMEKVKLKETSKSNSDSAIIAKAVEGLGHLCFWNIKGAYKPEKLRQAAIDVGLPSYINIPDRDIRGSVTCSNRKFKYKNPTTGMAVKAEIVHEDYIGITVGFLEREVNSKNAKWLQFDSVTIDWQKLFIDSGNSNAAEKYVDLLNREMEHYFGNDIRYQIITPILKKTHSITLHAGLRFITKNYEEELLRLQEFMEEIGAEFNVMTQLSNDLTKKTIKSEATKTLSKRVAEVTEKLSVWKERATIRSDAEENMLAELSDIKDQAELIQDALQIKLSSITTELEAAKDEAMALIKGQAPKGMSKVINAFKNAMVDEYSLKNKDGEVFFMVPEEEWADMGLNFRYRKTDGNLAKRSVALSALKSIGHYAYVKDENLVIRPLE